MLRKNPLLVPDTHRSLLRRLKLCETRDHQDCCSFRLSQREEEVRMSLNDVIIYGKMNLPEEKVKNPKELAEFIMQMAEEEDNKGEQGPLQSVLELCLDELVEKVKREIARLEKEARELLAQFLCKREKRFLGLLKELDSKDFDLKIDEALASFSREQEGASREREQEIQETLKRKIQEAQAEIERKLAELRKQMDQALRVPLPKAPSNQKPLLPNFPKLHLDEKSLKQIPKMKMEYQTCLGTRGISFNPRNPKQVAILDYEGNLHLFDSEKQETIKRIKCEVKSRDVCNSVSFSPNGEQIQVSACSDSTISIYKTSDLSRIHFWNKKGTGNNIIRAQWLDETQVVASFQSPGVIEVVGLPKGNTQVKMSPTITEGSDGLIYDFDVSPSKEELVGAGRNKSNGKSQYLVFSMRMSNGNKQTQWTHQKHTDLVNVVKFSHCGNYVLSGADDKSLILANAKDGSILQQEDKWFSHSILGLIFSPKDQNILVQSWNEFVLIDFKENKRMEKKQEVKKNQIDSSASDINSVNVFWDLGNRKEQKVLIGMSNGSIHELGLRE